MDKIKEELESIKKVSSVSELLTEIKKNDTLVENITVPRLIKSFNSSNQSLDEIFRYCEDRLTEEQFKKIKLGINKGFAETLVEVIGDTEALNDIVVFIEDN